VVDTERHFHIYRLLQRCPASVILIYSINIDPRVHPRP